MKKRMDFDVWYQSNVKDLNYLLKDIFKSLSNLDIAQSFNMDFDIDDDIKDSLLKYLYMNSSSALV